MCTCQLYVLYAHIHAHTHTHTHNAHTYQFGSVLDVLGFKKLTQFFDAAELSTKTHFYCEK